MNHGDWRISLGLSLWSLLAIAPSTLGAASLEIAREVCVVPGHGGLGLDIPLAWHASCVPLAKPASASASFKPREGGAFDLKVTAVWMEPAHRNALADASLRSNLEHVGADELSHAVEPSPVIEEMRGAEAFGYSFSLTDKAPAPGEFKYMTQGSLRVGELQVIFTLLSREEKSTERSLALAMLSAARHVKK